MHYCLATVNGREIVLTIEIKSNSEALDVHSKSYSIILLPAVNDKKKTNMGSKESKTRQSGEPAAPLYMVVVK